MIADLITLRLAGKTIFSQAALQGQLAQVEWTEEKNRLLKMFMIVLPGFACLLCLLIFSGVLVLLLGWSTAYRIPILVFMIFIYGAGVGFAWLRFRNLARQGEQSFAASREEIAADLALLRSRL